MFNAINTWKIFFKFVLFLCFQGNFQSVKAFNTILWSDQQVYGIASNRRRSHSRNSARVCKERKKDPVTHWLRNLGEKNLRNSNIKGDWNRACLHHLLSDLAHSIMMAIPVMSVSRFQDPLRMDDPKGCEALYLP